ncbi:MAG: hypothetical protein ACFCUH_12410 [Flavobacteriales bacterium]
MNIFKFRVIINTEEDVFRDIEIATDDSFESLHKAILGAFDFDEGEMASFYMSDDTWSQGEEVSLMEMSEGGSNKTKSMSDVALDSMLGKPDDKMVYVYDFLRMWSFYVELVEVKKAAASTIYPRVALVFGDAPEQESKESDLFEDFDFGEEVDDYRTGDPEIDSYLDDMDEDGYGEFDEFGSIDDLDDERY